MPPQAKLNAAIIGCGRIGSTFEDILQTQKPHSHAGAYAAHPNVSLVAGCDQDNKVAHDFGERWSVKAYKDYISMLRSEKVELLSICTPPQTHMQIIKDAILYGKDLKLIWCEKPITVSLDEAYTVAKLIGDSKIKLAINYWRRWDPLHNKIAATLSEGIIGTPHTLFCQAHVGIVNTCTHMFDLIKQYTGSDIKSIYADIIADGSSDPGGTLQLVLENNLHAFIDCNWKEKQRFGMSIWGEKGNISAFSDGVLLNDFTVNTSQTKWKPKHFFRNTQEFNSPMYLAVDNFVDVVFKKAPLICDINNGLDTLKLAVGAHISSTKNELICLRDLSYYHDDTIILGCRSTSLTRDGK